MERPALKRLFAGIESGDIDCVVVYKVDRLSRSLLDFARMMELFDKQAVSNEDAARYGLISSGQSLVTLHVESLPFEERLRSYALLKRCVGGQKGRVDLSPVQQQIQERPLGVREGKYR